MITLRDLGNTYEDGKYLGLPQLTSHLFFRNISLRWIPCQRMVRRHGRPLRRTSKTVTGSNHSRRVRTQVRRRTSARSHLRSHRDQSPSSLQVHTTGRQIRRGCGEAEQACGLRPSHQPDLLATQRYGDARHARMGHRMGCPQTGIQSQA